MSAYQPPFHITNQMLMYVSSVSEKIGEINVIRNMEAKPHLRKNNRIKSIHSSLKIEANSLSLEQVRDVIDGHIVLGEQKEIQEVKNAYAAYEKLDEIDSYSMKDLKKFHGIMTKYTVEESGDFRKGEEGVFDGGKCIFMAPPARMVPELMSDLFGWMEQEKNTVHPLILASRLWHTALLAKWKPVFAFIPVESQIEKFQEEYYQAISECHKAGNSDLFIEFMLKQIDAVLDDISRQAAEDDERVTEYMKKMLSVMEYGMPYTSKTIMDKLGLKSKETFRKNYLNPAMEMHMVEMTIPDKPRSRNQRYVKI